MNEIITILNFATGEVIIKRLPDDINEDNLEEWINDTGNKTSDCQWMITQTLNLNIETL